MRSDQYALFYHLMFLLSVNYLNKTNLSGLARLRGVGRKSVHLVMYNLGQPAFSSTEDRYREGCTSQERCPSCQLLHNQQLPKPIVSKGSTFPLLQNQVNSSYGINCKVSFQLYLLQVMCKTR